CFLEFKESGYNSEDDSFLGNVNNLDTPQHDKANSTGKSDDEGVSDTIFSNNSQSPCHDRHEENVQETTQHSEEPFGFYKLLKKPINNPVVEDATSLSHPPGFTPQEHFVNDSACEATTQVQSRFTHNGGSWTWLPTNSKILIVVIYAPQCFTLKRHLWEYISGLINRWKGETIVLGDFNESHFMVKEGIVLGHKISKKGIEVDKAKIEVISKLPHPTIVKGIRSFLRHAGFYRRFIKDFSKISRPMTHLLEKNSPFIFSNECIQAFRILKDKLTEAPILIAPNWDQPFELMYDASDYAVGAVLGQRIEKHFRPIHYASKTMNQAEANYTTTEKEMLAVVYVLS
nr:reverse transcriptase domain-containing protein [Tanacetum cinerariifolium]